MISKQLGGGRQLPRGRVSARAGIGPCPNGRLPSAHAFAYELVWEVIGSRP